MVGFQSVLAEPQDEPIHIAFRELCPLCSNPGFMLWLGYDAQTGFSYSSLLRAVVFGPITLRELIRGIKDDNK